MAPALPVGDVVDGVRREVARNAFRARNGIKYATGGQWAPVAATESTTNLAAGQGPAPTLPAGSTGSISSPR